MALPSLLTGGPLIALQAALQMRIQAAFPAAQCDFAMIPARITKREFDRLSRRSPTIALGWMGWRPAERLGREFRGDAEWILVIVQSRSASVAGRVIGDTTGPGQLGMVQLAIANLHGWTIGAADVANALAGAQPIGSAMQSAAWVAPTPQGVNNLYPAATGIGTVSIGEVTNLFSDEWGSDDHVLTGLRLTVNATLDDPDETVGLADALLMGMTWVMPGGDAQLDQPMTLGSE